MSRDPIEEEGGINLYGFVGNDFASRIDLLGLTQDECDKEVAQTLQEPRIVKMRLLQDLVADDCSAVKFFSPFQDFNSPPVPNSIPAYLAYRELAIRFIEARNQRIQTWWAIHRPANE